MRVNEIFYSLQGEGYYTGRAAIFVRFSGCNLNCPFCDTDFKSSKEMTENEVVNEMKNLSKDCKFVVLTGGEPTLQVNKGFIQLLHHNGYYVAIETNGTRQVPDNVDWVTVSPKKYFTKNAEPIVTCCDELKVIFDNINNPDDCNIFAYHKYLQPCDTGDVERNKEIIENCIEYIKKNPEWLLSLQTQKVLNVR